MTGLGWAFMIIITIVWLAAAGGLLSMRPRRTSRYLGTLEPYFWTYLSIWIIEAGFVAVLGLGLWMAWKAVLA